MLRRPVQNGYDMIRICSRYFLFFPRNVIHFMFLLILSSNGPSTLIVDTEERVKNTGSNPFTGQFDDLARIRSDHGYHVQIHPSKII